MLANSYLRVLCNQFLFSNAQIIQSRRISFHSSCVCFHSQLQLHFPGACNVQYRYKIYLCTCIGRPSFLSLESIRKFFCCSAPLSRKSSAKLFDSDLSSTKAHKENNNPVHLCLIAAAEHITATFIIREVISGGKAAEGNDSNSIDQSL